MSHCKHRKNMKKYTRTEPQNTDISVSFSAANVAIATKRRTKSLPAVFWCHNIRSSSTPEPRGRFSPLVKKMDNKKRYKRKKKREVCLLAVESTNLAAPLSVGRWAWYYITLTSSISTPISPSTNPPLDFFKVLYNHYTTLLFLLYRQREPIRNFCLWQWPRTGGIFCGNL